MQRIRRPSKELYLVIVDHDTKRFTIEGPTRDDLSWVVEVDHARRAGRRIAWSRVDDDLGHAAAVKMGLGDYEFWPSGSIVVP